MKEYLVNTKRESCAVKFLINTNGSEIPIYIVGYDPITPNTFYFKSRFLITGTEEVILNCPQSPINLHLCIWAHKDFPFDILNIDKIPFSKNETGDPVITFVEKFSRYAGILRPGIFIADNVPFKIELVRAIYTQDGRIHPTPARISVEQPIIQVNKIRFDDMSIPERVIILLHEVSHNYINYDQDDELESDQNGLNIYKQLGYPKIEAINAFANIMADTPQNYERMLNLISI